MEPVRGVAAHGPAGEARYEFEADHPLYGLQTGLVGQGKRVLEVGCASGHVTKAMAERGCRVVGLEVDPGLAAVAEQWAEDVLVVDLDLDDFVEKLRPRQFDVLLFGDVLEHLRDPTSVLRAARELLVPGGYVVISVPNIAHVDVKLSLLEGSFEYRDYGLLDRTHLRFFTRASVDHLLHEAGLLPVERLRYTIEPFHTELAPSRDVPTAVLDAALRDPDSTTYQFIVKAVVDDGDRAMRDLADRCERLEDELHAPRAERDQARGERIAELEHELEAMRNTKLFRATDPLRRLYGRLVLHRRH